MTVTNLTDKLAGISVSMPRSYELQDSGCTTLAPNASCVLTIVFVPLENGDLPGTISVTASALDGTGSQTSQIYADGFGVGTGMLTIRWWLDRGGGLQFWCRSSGPESITKSSRSPTRVRRPSPFGEWSVRRRFSPQQLAEGALLPAASCTVSMTYSPGAGGSSAGGPGSGTDIGSLTVESDAQSSPNILDLEGQTSAGAGAGGASGLTTFSLSESALSFGTTTVGDTSATQSVVLTNTGASALQVSSVSSPAGFKVQNGCGLVTAGSSCTIMVASSPQSAGTLLSALEIGSSAADSLEYVTLITTGASSPLTFSPASLSFGSVLVGKSPTQQLQVRNAGSSTVTFSSITFSSITAPGEFAVAGDCPSAGDRWRRRQPVPSRSAFSPPRQAW